MCVKNGIRRLFVVIQVAPRPAAVRVIRATPLAEEVYKAAAATGLTKKQAEAVGVKDAPGLHLVPVQIPVQPHLL